MRTALVTTFLISILFNSIALASENNASDLISLDEDTFVKAYKSSDGSETIQLYKVEKNKINLIDAIRVDETRVNLKPLFEYQRLDIKQK